MAEIVNNSESLKVVTVTQNSMRATIAGESSKHIVEVRSRAQALITDISFEDIDTVVVKLISTDLPDKIYYSIDGKTLQKILQDKFTDFCVDASSNAFIPFALSGNLELSDDSYIEVTFNLNSVLPLKYDRVISPATATSPFLIKLIENQTEFDSQFYNELHLIKKITDVNFVKNGKAVHIPQLLILAQRKALGRSKVNLVANTNYVLSESTSFYLVEY